MYRRRIRFEKFLLPALAFSAACHLLAALVPVGAVEFIFHRRAQVSRTVRFEVLELPEETLKVVATRSPEVAALPPRVIEIPPPLPRIRQGMAWRLAAVDPGLPVSLPGSAPDEIPAVPAASAVAPDSAASLDSYLSRIVARIESVRRYPETARLMGQQGTVQVAFAIGRDGQLRQPARLVEPSPFGSLNRAACTSVQRGNPFPPLPSCIDRDTLDVTVRIVFQLQ